MHGAESADVAATLNNMANVYERQSRFAKALEAFGRALAIFERVHGAESADVAETLNNMANVYERQSRFAKALEAFGRALAIYERVHGAESADVAATLNGMAIVYRRQSRFAEALEARRTALPAYVCAHDDNGAATCDSKRSLAALLLAAATRLGTAQADAHVREARDLLLAVCDADSTLIARPEHERDFPAASDWLGHFRLHEQLARCHERLGEPRRAAGLWVELAQFFAHPDRPHLRVLAVLAYQRALVVWERCVDAGADAARCLDALAALAVADGRTAEALRCGTRAATKRGGVVDEFVTTDGSLDTDIFWQWQHCLDNYAELHRGILEDQLADGDSVSERSKNRATQLIIRLRGLLDQVWVRVVRARIPGISQAMFSYAGSRLGVCNQWGRSGIFAPPVVTAANFTLHRLNARELQQLLCDAHAIDQRSGEPTGDTSGLDALLEARAETLPYQPLIQNLFASGSAITLQTLTACRDFGQRLPTGEACLAALVAAGDVQLTDGAYFVQPRIEGAGLNLEHDAELLARLIRPAPSIETEHLPALMLPWLLSACRQKLLAPSLDRTLPELHALVLEAMPFTFHMRSATPSIRACPRARGSTG